MYAGDPTRRSELALVWTAIGLAFQIVDDVLDRNPDFRTTRQNRRKRYCSEKVTYPALFGIEASIKKADALVAGAFVHEMLLAFGRIRSKSWLGIWWNGRSECQVSGVWLQVSVFRCQVQAAVIRCQSSPSAFLLSSQQCFLAAKLLKSGMGPLQTQACAGNGS